MDITLPYPRLFELLLRSSPFVFLSEDDPILPQLQVAQKNDELPRIYIELLPAGTVCKEEYFTGAIFKTKEGKPVIRQQNLYKVWNRIDWDISYKRDEVLRQASADREAKREAYKIRLDRLKQAVTMQTGLEGADAERIAKNILNNPNADKLEENFLNGK